MPPPLPTRSRTPRWTALLHLPLPDRRPTADEKGISRYASFWARHVGTAYRDGATEFPLFVLAVSLAHGRAYNYDTAFLALRLHNREKLRWDFVLPTDDSHGFHPLYFRAVQGHTPSWMLASAPKEPFTPARWLATLPTRIWFPTSLDGTMSPVLRAQAYNGATGVKSSSPLRTHAPTTPFHRGARFLATTPIASHSGGKALTSPWTSTASSP